MDTLLQLPNLLSLKDFARKHTTFPLGTLRWLIFNGHDRTVGNDGKTITGNGLEASGALVRVGRRIYINEVLFFQWVLSAKPTQAKPKLQLLSE